jgi:citrate lyase subunit beta/citryl-CoA lyase
MSGRRPSRIRSELSVPASDQRKIVRGLASEADSLFLDLEDSVAPGRKQDARLLAIEAVREGDWRGRSRCVRINQICSQWCHHDIIDLFGASSRLIDRLVVPKVQSAGDIGFVDHLLTGLERETQSDRAVTLEVQIEDPVGLYAIDEILAASDRISVVTFGQGDFAAASGMPAVDIGVDDQWDAAVRGDRWLGARQQIVFAAVRHGIQALNGSYANFRDHDGFRRYARMSRALGFAGVWCIHPDQIAIAHDVFTPSAEEIDRAQGIVAAMAAHRGQGTGTFAKGETMIDEASIRMARQVLAAAGLLARQEETAGQ